jgi:hypothetical protein
MVGMGYATSAAFYRRGLQATFGHGFEYIFLVCETNQPHLCSLVGVDPAWGALGAAQVQSGLAAWTACRLNNHFPGYPDRVCYPEVPAFLMRDWEESLPQEAA